MTLPNVPGVKKMKVRKIRFTRLKKNEFNCKYPVIMLYVIRLNQSRILLYFIFWFGLVRVLFLNGEREKKRGVFGGRGGMLFPVGLFPVPLVVVVVCRNHIHRPSSIDGQLS